MDDNVGEPRIATCGVGRPVRHEKVQHNTVPEDEDGRRCTRIIALNRYLAMGSKRSVKELFAQLQREFGDAAPTMRTLNRWAADRDHYAGKNWAAFVQDYELMVAEEVMKKLATADAIVVFDEVSAFRKVAAGMLTAAEQILSGKFKPPGSTKEQGLAIVGSVKEVTAMLNAAVEASEHVRKLVSSGTGDNREFASGRMATLAAAMPAADLEQRHKRYLNQG